MQIRQVYGKRMRIRFQIFPSTRLNIKSQMGLSKMQIKKMEKDENKGLHTPKEIYMRNTICLSHSLAERDGTAQGEGGILSVSLSPHYFWGCFQLH